jgi:hypothetical protein
MPTDLPISDVVFDMLCAQAEAGRSIDLARAGLRPTFEQAKALVSLMNGAAVLSLRKDGLSVRDLVELRMSGCRLVDVHPSDRPQTPCPDGLDFS